MVVVPYPQSTHQQNGHAQIRTSGHPMESRPTTEYPSAALSSGSYQGYSGSHIDQNGEQSASTPQHPQTSTQDARSTYSSSATPTSETSTIYSSRTPTFAPDQIIGAPRYVEGAHRYQPASTASGDSTVPAPSPSFTSPAHYGSQYPPAPHNMSESYPHPGTPNQAWRQDWSPYGPAPHQMNQSPYGHTPSPTTMSAAPPGMVSTARPSVSANKQNRKRAGDQPTGHPLSQVYSFVPIPGAQQNKRPRRRYEEIERMYKCGWNGCEKAYGTLNHLNAHVTMQGHGAKRTPDEFKEIRKEWKARKKEEELQRKQADDEARQRAAQDAVSATSAAEPQPSVTPTQYVSGMPPQRQLPPPLAYQPNVSLPNGGVYTTTSAAPTAPMENMQQYGQAQQMYTGYAPPAGYAQSQQMFAGQQRPAPQSNGNSSTTTAPTYSS
ncbi:hypothetical protein EDC01DRAFT_225610 [Geopyxis carbonaria]|nr:hypothetical protein EDC01DRAFT_225610 [Geopyxis carbonaria]